MEVSAHNPAESILTIDSGGLYVFVWDPQISANLYKNGDDELTVTNGLACYLAHDDEIYHSGPAIELRGVNLGNGY